MPIVLLLALLLCWTQPARSEENDFPEPPPEKEFVFANAQQRNDYNLYCELFMGRGDACENLIKQLCPKINHERKECAALQAADCQKKNISSQDDAEKTCENGVHAGPCSGNKAACEYEEENACARSSYDLRYCGHYKYMLCEGIGRDGQGEFKNKACRLFHNEVMIEFWEEKITQKLRWPAYGEQNVKASIKAMGEQRKAMEDQLEAVQDKLESLTQQIANALEGLIPALKKQRKEAEKQRDQLIKEIGLITKKLKEFEYMSGVCESTKSL